MADNYETLDDVIYYSQWGPLSSLIDLEPPPQYLVFRDETGTTALHYACANGHTDIVIWILTQLKQLDEPDFMNLINITNSNGNTPLHWAALRGHSDIVQALLDYGVEVNIKNKEDRTPLDEALRKGHKECADKIKDRGETSNKHYDKTLEKQIVL